MNIQIAPHFMPVSAETLKRLEPYVAMVARKEVPPLCPSKPLTEEHIALRIIGRTVGKLNPASIPGWNGEIIKMTDSSGKTGSYGSYLDYFESNGGSPATVTQTAKEAAMNFKPRYAPHFDGVSVLNGYMNLLGTVMRQLEILNTNEDFKTKGEGNV
jgi:hypothetical protein